ncbi:MAG: prolipoprotein diacylglyceryl transferase [Alphaproteobacteria bacterium]|nr:prolipoprotein diacylglyceryl transferase [Alphaproteobacteria bacterium]
MTGPLLFPSIDPIAFQIGPFAVRWYALAYIAGLIAGWVYILWLLRRAPKVMTREQVGDFLTWAILGVILGGRLGYIIFYHPDYYVFHVQEIFYVWEGGMSFHGGFLGLTGAVILYCRKKQLSFWSVADLIAAAVPIGLFLGRLANFVNGELYGRTTNLPWGMVFPTGGPAPRHPSQLYEAGLEGLALFILLFIAIRFFNARAHPGLTAGLFLTGYGAARMFVELFREPDAHLGFLFGSITMGQLLSLPLVLAGIWFMTSSRRRPLTVVS